MLLRLDTGCLHHGIPAFGFALVKIREVARGAAAADHIGATPVRLGLGRLHEAVDSLAPALHEPG